MSRPMVNEVAGVDSVQTSDDRLCTLFAAISNPTRLAILRKLCRPIWLSDIQVKRTGSRGALTSISRQAVKEHLDHLLQVGLVLPVTGEGDQRHGPRYVLNHREVFSLAEMARELSRLRSEEELGGSTIAAPTAYRKFDIRPQALVMVKGPDEGRTFALEPPTEDPCEWVIGRTAPSEIILDHDAFISGANTRIEWVDGAYFVSDLPHSKNGTRLNFHPLEAGQPERMRTGDLVSIGRTILMFRG